MLSFRSSLAAGRKTACLHASRNITPRRGLLTLAIETSCDDTAVAIVSRRGNSSRIHFNERIAPDLTAYRGIHPIRALESHQSRLGGLVNRAIHALPYTTKDRLIQEMRRLDLNDPEYSYQNLGRSSPIMPLPNKVRDKPDIISVTRGPGMRSNLNVGLELAKGLALAWQIPLVGVHHMQAHLLTPRFVSSEKIPLTKKTSPITPEFPFVSILASGGHTMLVNSTDLITHKTLATAADIAVGDGLDKVARQILPDYILSRASSTNYARMLHEFAFENGDSDFESYKAPQSRADEIATSKVETAHGVSFTIPYANTREMSFSFAHLSTVVGQLAKRKAELAAGGGQEIMSDDERVHLAREVLRTSFEHIASRSIIALESLCQKENGDPAGKPLPETLPVKTLVVSGGVAANPFLRKVLREFLDARGFGGVELVVPPPALCTDNAVMIGWAGIEMYKAGWKSKYSIRPLRKWALEDHGRPAAEGGEAEAEGEKKVEVDEDDAKGRRGIIHCGGWVKGKGFGLSEEMTEGDD